jgi:hypothetical protein
MSRTLGNYSVSHCILYPIVNHKVFTYGYPIFCDRDVEVYALVVHNDHDTALRRANELADLLNRSGEF